MPDFGLYLTSETFSNYDVGNSYFIGLHIDDIKSFYNFEDNLFDFLILDHVAQKTINLDILFDNCRRILKNEGKLIVIVPDLFLNEKFMWPSKNNNLYSFSLKYSNHIIRRNDHWHIESNFSSLLNKYNFVLDFSILCDNNYDYNKSMMSSNYDNVHIMVIYIKKEN